MVTEQVKQQTHKIAIIEGDYSYDDHGDRFMADHITEWTEVTEEEYAALKKYQFMSNPPYYIIVQRPVQDVLEKAVAYYIKKTEEYRRQEEARQKRAKLDAAKAAEKKAEAAKRKLEKLAREAGVILVPKASSN